MSQCAEDGPRLHAGPSTHCTKEDATFNSEDSIDGLGMTFEHLDTPSKLLALFRLLKKLNTGQLTDEQRIAIGASLDTATALSDRNQAVLREMAAQPIQVQVSKEKKK